MDQRERVQWLIDEIGYSEDGLTVRDSIAITDTVLAPLLDDQPESARERVQQAGEAIAFDSNLLRYVVLPGLGLIVAILFGLAVQVQGLRSRESR